MTKLIDVQFSENGMISRIPGLGVWEQAGPTVPTDATAGFAPGCRFYKISGNGVGSTMYINEGSATSCDFNSVT